MNRSRVTARRAALLALFAGVITSQCVARAQDAAEGGPIIVESGEANAVARLTDWLKNPDAKGLLTVGHGGRPAGDWSVMVLLTNDDRLAAAAVRFEDDVVHVERTAAQADADMSIPVEFVKGLVFAADLPVEEREEFVRGLESHENGQDVVFLSGQDRLEGELQQIRAGQVELRSRAAPISVALPRVRAIAFSRDLWSLSKAAWPPAQVVAADGSILTGAAPSVQESRLAITWIDEKTATVPFTSVRELVLAGMDVIPIDPKSVESTYQPFLPGAEVPAEGDASPSELRWNRNVRGGLLTVGGRISPRGLGMFSGTTATIPIPEGAVRFFASAGIDDEVGTGGAVEFKVLVDGHERWTSGVVAGTSGARVIDVNVRGGNVLSLIVDYGPGGDVQDVADWCELVFLR